MVLLLGVVHLVLLLEVLCKGLVMLLALTVEEKAGVGVHELTLGDRPCSLAVVCIDRSMADAAGVTPTAADEALGAILLLDRLNVVFDVGALDCGVGVQKFAGLYLRFI